MGRRGPNPLYPSRSELVAPIVLLLESGGCLEPQGSSKSIAALWIRELGADMVGELEC